MDEREVTYEVQGPAARLTINREAARNALSVGVIAGLIQGLDRAEAGHLVKDFGDEVVEFLCSERNTYTTGSVWSVKGGSG